jgi:hypothetical protein
MELLQPVTGTLLVRHPRTPAARNFTPVAVVGVLELPAGLKGESFYRGAVSVRHRSLALDPLTCRQAPELHQFYDETPLQALVERNLWTHDPRSREICTFFLRRTEIRIGRNELYLALTCLPYGDREKLRDGELIDLRDGLFQDRLVLRDQADQSLDSIVTAPFYLHRNGKRHALPTSVGPLARQRQLAVQEIVAIPPDRRPADYAARLRDLNRDPYAMSLLAYYLSDEGKEAREALRVSGFRAADQPKGLIEAQRSKRTATGRDSGMLVDAFA